MTSQGMPPGYMNNLGTPIPEGTMGSETNQSSLSAMPSVGQLSSGQVNVNDILTIGGSWNRWESLSGPFISAPTACARDNRLDIFAIGFDSQLYHKCYENDRLKFDWTSLGGAIIYPPSAISRDTNLIDVFAIGKTKEIYQKSWNGERWTDWQSLEGTGIHGVTATSWGENRIDLFTVGTNSVIYHKFWDGKGWIDWQPLILESQDNWEISSTCIHAPVAVSRKENYIDIFAVGIDNHIYHASGNGITWTGWEDVGGPSILGISATSRSPETIDLFTISTDIIETDNHLYYRFMENNEWSKWHNLGGTCISAPAAVARGSDRLDAFAIGTMSELWQKSWAINGNGEVSISMGGVEVIFSIENRKIFNIALDPGYCFAMCLDLAKVLKTHPAKVPYQDQLTPDKWAVVQSAYEINHLDDRSLIEAQGLEIIDYVNWTAFYEDWPKLAGRVTNRTGINVFSIRGTAATHTLLWYRNNEEKLYLFLEPNLGLFKYDSVGIALDDMQAKLRDLYQGKNHGDWYDIFLVN